MDIMNAAKEAEYEKLVLAGEPLTKKEQKELKEQNEQNEQSVQPQNVQPNLPADMEEPGTEWVE